jgi:hypothetical protein
MGGKSARAKDGSVRMPERQKPEIEKDPTKVREQPEVAPPKREQPEVEERPRGLEVPEIPDPDGPREQPEIDEGRAPPDTDVERGPSSDVGGPRGIERGTGIETGEEVGGFDVERGGAPPGDSRR